MRIVSLFSGAGGLDLGFKNAGFDIVWANDIFKDAASTYRKNIGDHINERPISEIDSADIPICDGVIGGFPCQGFSLANTGRSEDDQRNKLYLEFVRVISDKKPKFFVAENVKGILSLGNGQVFKRIVGDFADAGYLIYHQLFNAADYGVPQRRERVFLFGIRRNVDARPICFPPKPTHAPREKAFNLGLKPWVSVGDALRHLPEPGVNNILNHQQPTQYKLRFNGYLGHRAIDPTLPSPTITARGDERGGVVIIHHPSNLRRMTVREVAAVQSFPDDYMFCGSKTSGYRQIGNAVPPKLAEVIARSVLSSMATTPHDRRLAVG